MKEWTYEVAVHCVYVHEVSDAMFRAVTVYEMH